MSLEKAFGATVKGSFHVENKMPNQDSFLINNNQDYTLACVADGLGSKKMSHVASKMLCRIINREIKLKFKYDNFHPYETIIDIQNKYLKAIRKYSFKNADTTCMFVLVSNKNIFVFKVGDGLAAVISDEVIVLSEDEEDFLNETKSFGTSNINDWKFKTIIKEEGVDYKIVLATDGVGNDLIIDDLNNFVTDLSGSISKKKKNNRELKRLLKTWPNKHNNDDKTIVVVK